MIRYLKETFLSAGLAAVFFFSTALSSCAPQARNSGVSALEKFEACGFDFDLDAFELNLNFCESRQIDLLSYAECSRETYELFKGLSQECQAFFYPQLRSQFDNRLVKYLATFDSTSASKLSAFLKPVFQASIDQNNAFAAINDETLTENVTGHVRTIWNSIYTKISLLQINSDDTPEAILSVYNQTNRSVPKISYFYGAALTTTILDIIGPRIRLLNSLAVTYCTLESCDSPWSLAVTSLAQWPERSVVGIQGLDQFVVLMNGIQKPARTTMQSLGLSLSDSSLDTDSFDETVPDLLRRLLVQTASLRSLKSELEQSRGQRSRLPLITSGADFATLKSVVGLFEKSNLNLEKRKDSISQLQRDYRAQVLASINDTTRLATVLAQADTKKLTRDDLIDDLLSVQAAYRQQESQLKDSLVALDGLPGLQFFEKSLNSRVIDRLAVNASNAKLEKGRVLSSGNLSDIAFKSYDMPAGHSLFFSVEGDWSPTCALRSSSYSSLVKTATGISIGPEGFVIGLSGQTSFVKSVTDSRTRSSSDQVTNSLGLGITKPVNASTSYSQSFGKSRAKTTSTTTSDSQSQSASFQDGLRLKDTPFENFPAGSLLAIIVPKGSPQWTQSSARFQVVNRNTALIADKDSEVYLVVNDCLEKNISAAAGNASPLNLTVSENIPVAEAGRELIEALAEIPERYKDKVDAIEKEGGQTAARSEALRSEILKDYQLNSRFSSLVLENPPLNAVLNSWLSNFSLQIQRRAEIRELSRRISYLDSELNAVDYESKENNKRLEVQGILLSQVLENTDLYLVQSDIDRQQNLMERTMLPLLRVYSPRALSGLQNLEKSTRDLRFNRDTSELIKDFTDVSSSLVKNFEEFDALNLNDSDQTLAILSFPNPSIYGSRKTNLYPVADEIRSQALWNALFSKAQVDATRPILITPEDLYSRYDKTGYIACSFNTPIIRNMRIFILHEKEAFTASQTVTFARSKLGLSIGDETVLVSGSNIPPFRRESSLDGRDVIGVRLLADGLQATIPELMNDRFQPGTTLRGFSPFTGYSFSGAIDNIFGITTNPESASVEIPSDILEILIAFELDVRKNTGFDAKDLSARCR